jgi:chromosome segregation ATPase
MSGLSRLERLHRWNLDAKRRQANELDRLIDELAGELSLLETRVRSEIEAARGDVALERALPPYRKMMGERRERMERSVAGLRSERDRLQQEIQAAFNELKSTEQIIANRAERIRQTERRKERAVSDEIGRQQHYRR